MFPVSDKASSVVSALINKVRSLGVQIMTDSPVSHVIYAEGTVKGVQLSSGKTISTAAVIIATGGKSVPQTGSTGDGYPWAEAAGHTITELFPTEVPIISREEWIKSGELQGLSLRDVALTVWNPKGKKVISHRGDMIFTHFGLSGPIALRCSQFLRQVQRKSGTDTVEMSIDLFPDLTAQEVEAMVQDKLEQEPKKAIRNSLKGLLPERLIPLLLAKADLDGDITGHHVSKNGLLALAGILKRMPVYVHGTRSLSGPLLRAAE